ncbi:MAG: hypothetical protein WC335_04635 [Candidatus Omnitrophota bacterium]|jgi:hypothetical protein
MKMRIVLVLMMGVLGLAAGMAVKTVMVKASSPEKGCPITVEGVPTVVYDEEWEPLAAFITAEKSAGTYEVARYSFSDNQVTFKDGSSRKLSDVKSGESGGPGLETAINVFPKFKVIRWQVSGHAHFK